MFLQRVTEEGEFPLGFGGDGVNRFLSLNSLCECGCFQAPRKGEEPFPQLLDVAHEPCPWGSPPFPARRLVSVKHPGAALVLQSPRPSPGARPPLPAPCPCVRVVEAASGPNVSVGTETRSECGLYQLGGGALAGGAQEVNGDPEACSTTGLCGRSPDGAAEGWGAPCVGATGPAGASRAPSSPWRGRRRKQERASSGLLGYWT